MCPITASMAQRRRSSRLMTPKTPGDENAAGIDIGTLDLAAGKPFGVFDHDAQRVAIIGVARQRFGVQHELAAWCAGIGGGDRGLDAELVGCADLALANALNLGSV